MHRTLFSFLLSLSSTAIVFAQTLPNPASNVKGNPGEETCVVLGVVTRSLDNAPLKNATVQLVSGEDREHTIATRTTADGHFELRSVPSGRYRMKVSRDGYVEQEFGQKKPTDPGATFVLRPGQKMSELIFKLGRAGVITGRVFNADGEPVPNAMLNAIRQVYREGKREFESSAWDRSNDLGEYRIFGLAPGRYYVSAEEQPWNRVVGDKEFNAVEKDIEEKAYAKTYFPATLDLGRASTVTVLLQMLTGVDLTFPSLMFGHVALGQTKTLSTTLINLDSTTLTIDAIQVMGSDKDEFSQVNTCGSTVAAGQSCTISVTFKPTEAGVDSGVVSISDDGPGSQQQVSLVGYGCVYYPLRHICY